MIQGDTEYKSIARKLRQLESISIPTLEEQVEIAHWRRRVFTTELRVPARGITGNLEALVDDYAVVLAAGDLGGTELG